MTISERLEKLGFEPRQHVGSTLHYSTRHVWVWVRCDGMRIGSVKFPDPIWTVWVASGDRARPEWDGTDPGDDRLAAWLLSEEETWRDRK